MEQINKKIDTYIDELLNEKKDYHRFNKFACYLLRENHLIPTQQQYIDIYKIIKIQRNDSTDPTTPYLSKPKYNDYSGYSNPSIKIIYKYPDLISCNFKNNERDEYYLNFIKFYLIFNRDYDISLESQCGEWIYSFLKKHFDYISNELSIKIIKMILKVNTKDKYRDNHNENRNLFVFSSLILFKPKIGVNGYIENSLVYPLVTFLPMCCKNYISRYPYRHPIIDNPFINDIEKNFNEIIKFANDNGSLDNETFQSTMVYLLSICKSNSQRYYYNLIDQDTNLNIFNTIEDKIKITKKDYDIIIKPLIENGEFSSSLVIASNFLFDCNVFKKVGGPNRCIQLFREYCNIQKVKDDEFTDTIFPIDDLKDEIFKLDESLLNELEKGPLINCFKSRINKILSKSTINIDDLYEMLFNIENCQIRKSLISEQYLDQFIASLDDNLMDLTGFGFDFKNEFSNIISNENRLNDPIRNKLIHRLTFLKTPPRNVLQNFELSNTITTINRNNISIPFIIIKDIILFYLEHENNENSLNVLNISLVSKKSFTIVKEYINNITISPIINYEIIRKLINNNKKNGYQFSNLSLIDLNNIKSLKNYHHCLPTLIKNIDNGIINSLVHIEIESMDSKGWYKFKDQTITKQINHIKQLKIQVKVKSVNIGNYFRNFGYYRNISITKDDDFYHNTQIGNSVGIDFSIHSKLIVNLSSFLKIYNENPLIANIKHIEINAPLCFSCGLVEGSYLNNQKQQLENINGSTNFGGLEILEINLFNKRSIQRLLNTFGPISIKLNKIKFNVLYKEDPLPFSGLVSTIFNLISNNSKFSTVTKIIIMNSRKNTLNVKWNAVNYYSFNCIYPFDFKTFTRVNLDGNNHQQQTITTSSLSEIDLYGNDINEINKPDHVN